MRQTWSAPKSQIPNPQAPCDHEPCALCAEPTAVAAASKPLACGRDCARGQTGRRTTDLPPNINDLGAHRLRSCSYVLVAGHYPVYSACLHGPTRAGNFSERLAGMLRRHRATV